MKSHTASRGCRAWRDPSERGVKCTKKSAPQRELKTAGKCWGRNEATLLLGVIVLSSPYPTGLLLPFLVRLSPFLLLGGGGVCRALPSMGQLPCSPSCPSSCPGLSAALSPRSRSMIWALLFAFPKYLTSGTLHRGKEVD